MSFRYNIYSLLSTLKVSIYKQKLHFLFIDDIPPFFFFSRLIRTIFITALCTHTYIYTHICTCIGVDYEGPRDYIGLVSQVREEAISAGFEIATPKKPKCGSMNAAQDRGGNGGHNDKCMSRGFISFGLCEQKLADSKECSALTFKHGECYLHDRSMTDHWSDKTEGAIYVTKFVKGLDKCI